MNFIEERDNLAHAYCGERPFGGQPEMLYHHGFVGFKKGFDACLKLLREQGTEFSKLDSLSASGDYWNENRDYHDSDGVDAAVCFNDGAKWGWELRGQIEAAKK